MTPPGATIATTPLGATTIGGNAEGKLEGTWTPTPEITPGSYAANATITYDDNDVPTTRSFAATFRIGTPSLHLALSPFTLQSGEIAHLQLSGTLAWNEPVEAYADVALLDAAGTTLVTNQGATTLFEPGTETLFPAFLEMPSVAAGNYTVVVTMRMAVSSGLLGETRQEASLAAAPGKNVVVTGGGARSSLLILLLVAVVALLLLAAWLLHRGRRRGRALPTDRDSAQSTGTAPGAAVERN